ncbi:MAG: site-specific integrase [Verrucomicrobiae bacterium]|nr:site-specific integrase [Verrucomicrobiae bacterium]
MKTTSKTASKSWLPTKWQGLYRHGKTGIYYLRLGKRTWKSLKTETQSVALKERDKLLAQETRRSSGKAATLGLKGTRFSDLVACRLTQLENQPSLKDSTRTFWKNIFTCLEKSWPGLWDREVDSLTQEECEKWAGSFSKTASASLFKHSLAAFRQVMKIAIKAGLRHSDPTEDTRVPTPPGKDLSLTLPNREQFALWVAEIRKSRSRWADDAADLVEFLAYSGLRIGEAEHVLWRHCDFTKGELIVLGDPVTGTKNRKTRRVPMIPALRALLERLRKERPKEHADAHVLRVHSAKDSMDRAADTLKLSRITHHDLRHLFATTCIESGVDIPTVSKWLGHQDGGALAMKVYGHLRNEHSLEQAKRVSFS